MRTVYPQPGYSESDVVNLLATNQFVYVDCYTIALISGDIMRYTSGQQDVSLFPIDDLLVRTYLAGSVLVSGIQFKIGIGVEVDEQVVRLGYNDTDIIPDREVPVSMALRRGDFDGARVFKDRFFAPNWGLPWIGGVRLFSGRVGTTSNIGRVEAELNVRSDLALLNLSMPRTMYQSSCAHTLFNSGCKLVKASFAVTGTVEAGSDNRVIYWDDSGYSGQSLSLGTIYIENEDNVAFSRTIRQAELGVLYLSYPLDFLPALGMEFTAFPGCPRTLASCDTFGNRANFKGFPFIPHAETAY